MTVELHDEISKIDGNSELKPYRSTFRSNNSGVPQGSVLGPLLFLLYINDLPDITNNPCILFADDISLIMTSNIFDISNYTIDINNTIDNIIQWLEGNNLHVNLSKTSYIQFRNYGRKHKDLEIHYKGAKLKEVDENPFLGIILDKNCNWKAHINNLCSKLNKFVHVLYQLSKTSAQDTAISAYYGYVSSILSYGLILWGNSTEVNRVFIVQKKCIRAIGGIPSWESCKPLFKKFKVLTLPCMYIFECAKFVRNNENLFIKAHELYPRNTRDPNRIVLPRVPKTTLYQKNCYVMCGRVFNAIPIDIKELPINQFKRKLRLWLLENMFYSVADVFNDSQKRVL